MASGVAGALFAVAALAIPAHASRFDWAGKVELDAAGLRSDDAKRRISAVHLLALDDIQLSEPFLLQALTDSDRSIRLEAGKALGAGRSNAAVPALIDWLADPDARTRAVAAEALGDIGGAIATPALARSLSDSDPAVRQTAVRALGKIGVRGNPEIAASLLPRLDDEKAEVRRETIEQLEQLGDRRAVIPLVSRFSDTSREVAKAAARAAGKLGDHAAAPALIRIMGDPDETFRRIAIQSLGRLGAVEAIDPLIEQLHSGGSDAFAGNVAYALGQIARRQNAGKAGEDAMRALVANLASANTRAAAVEGLRVAGAAAVPALVAQLSSRQAGGSTASSAIALLSEIGDDRATDALLVELERGRVAPSVVLNALRATRDPKALIPVLSFVSSPDVATRLAAIRALRQLLRGDARAGDALIERLDDDDLNVRILTAECLGELNAPTAIPKLAALARADAPMRLRLAAIDAMGAIARAQHSGEHGKGIHGDPSNVLVELLRHGPVELHAAASTALAYIGNSAVVPNLIALAKIANDPIRREVVRAIGGILRGSDNPAARALLRDLAVNSSAAVAVAAIRGLAAANAANDAKFLRGLLEHSVGDRQAEAARALGELHDVGSIQPLLGLLAFPDDRVAGAAAWALGEIVATAPTAGRAESIDPTPHSLNGSAAHPGTAGVIDPTPHSLNGSAVTLATLGSPRRGGNPWRGTHPGTAGVIDPTPHSLNGSAAHPGTAGVIDPTPHSLNGSAAHPGTAGVIDRWLSVSHHGGWSASINAAAALGRTLWGQPHSAHSLMPAQLRSLVSLTHHRSRLVRINAAFALSRLASDTTAADALVQMLRNDPSAAVRAAAAAGLGRLPQPIGRDALQAALSDAAPEVAAAAKTAIAGPPAPMVPRAEWRMFYVVDADGTRASNAPYFIHGTDGIVWASYTDANGELSSEHTPATTAAEHVWPASHEPEY